MAHILRVRDKDGNIIDIPAIIGPSAYQVAVKNGFQGTEKEWLYQLYGPLPPVTNEDNGKFMRVVDGAWAAKTMSNAEEATF